MAHYRDKKTELEGSPVKLGLLGTEQATQLALTVQQLQKLLVKLGLPSLRRTVPRQNPLPQSPLVKMDLLGPEQRAATATALQQAQCHEEAELAESSGGAGALSSRFAGTTKTAAAAALANSADEARPPRCAKHTSTTESVSPGDAGSSGSRAGGTTRGVGVPKISCQGKVEVVKSFPQERDSERKGEQSRVEGARMISCWDGGKIAKSFDVRRETRLQFLDRVQEWCGCEAAVVRMRLLSSAAVCNIFLHSHRRTSTFYVSFRDGASTPASLSTRKQATAPGKMRPTL